MISRQDKTILAIVASMLVLMVGSAVATDLTLNPEFTTMGITDAKTVDACITMSSGGPYVGVDLVVDTYCQDLNGNEVCDGADNILPAEFSAVVGDTPTDASGCGTIELETDGASGMYVYKVNGEDGGIEVAAESGLVLVPEFGVVAALTALGGAGLYIARKRKN